MIMMIMATRVEHLDFLPLYLLKFSRLYVIYIYRVLGETMIAVTEIMAEKEWNS